MDELTDEQLEPFKELIKEPMNEIKAKYGKDACEERLVSIQKA